MQNLEVGLMNLFCLILRLFHCGFRHVGNTVRFIRVRRVFRRNKQKVGEIEEWCDGKAGLKGVSLWSV